MRHGNKVNNLGRKTAHRKAMLANMACSLIEHKRINTTVAKAKALKQFVEPLITKSKAENNQETAQNTHNRRVVFSQLRNKYAVAELFSTVAEKVADRPGGYTRIIKLVDAYGGSPIFIFQSPGLRRILQEGGDYHVEAYLELEKGMTLADADDVKFRVAEKILDQSYIDDVFLGIIESDDKQTWTDITLDKDNK